MQEPFMSEDAPKFKSSRSKPKIILIVVAVLLVLAVLGIFVVKPLLSKKDKTAATAPDRGIVKIEKPATEVPSTPAPIPEVVKEPPVPNCIEGRAPIEVDKQEIDDIMGQWADAWTNKDFKKYKSFYSKKFKGIKRTIRPRTSNYTYGTWMGDRKGMLNYATWTKLGVENLEIQCASDEEVRVKFTQSYRSTTYNDVGPKTLTLNRQKGALKIVYEEMLEANPL